MSCIELYLHIPFCVRKCTYCDFTSFPCRPDHMAAYVSDVLKEADQHAAIWASRPVDTIYIGGGTPSVLPPEMMDHLLCRLLRPMQLNHLREFTSEANPGTLTKPWLDVMQSHGMNRISMGMQAYQDRLLQLLGRIHRHGEVISSVQMIRQAGIKRLSLDLMFGLPTQTMAEWKESLYRALDLQPEHLSCYGLILEEGTPLHRDVQAGKLQMLDVELERDMYEMTLSILGDAGYTPYELSNFASPGEECLHNVGYWTGVPYYGLGVSAASMDWTGNTDFPCIRWNNPFQPTAYHRMVNGIIAPEIKTRPMHDVEQVSRKDAMFEFFMVGLRLTRGVHASAFQRRFGVTVDDVYGDRLSTLAREGWIIREGDVIRMTRKGMDLQNTLLVELMD